MTSCYIRQGEYVKDYFGSRSRAVLRHQTGAAGEACGRTGGGVPSAGRRDASAHSGAVARRRSVRVPPARVAPAAAADDFAAPRVPAKIRAGWRTTRWRLDALLDRAPGL